MKKYTVVPVVVLFIFATFVSVFSNDIIWDDIGRGNLNLRTVLINPDNPGVIYIGSSNAILKSEDGGENWRRVLSVKGVTRAVNFLLFDPADKNSLYAATGNGLFRSANQGQDWRRIFQGKNYLENECTALAILPSAIYLGTKAGLFVSQDKGRSWHRQSGEIGKTSILAIAYNFKEPNYIYAASVGGVFMTMDSGQSWERSFIASPTENGNEEEEAAEGQDEAERNSCIRYLALDPNNPNYLYLATDKGVYKSQDRAKTWELLPDYGLLEKKVSFLLVSEQSCLYAVAKSGIFEYGDNRWKELSLGLAVTEINHLALDKQRNLYAASNRGLFRSSQDSVTLESGENIISIYSKDEPKINEVQQVAIKYAEVEPGKIKLWREQARKKAVLPQLSIGIDRSTTDLWHWESGSTAIGQSGDDLLRRGRDSIDWDVTLSWNLGELIWNDDQTSIDVRSRLMVQLREDVLDEVTKLYFERIRVKMELDNLSIEDRKKRFEKELRLQELTAQLDGLAGGYYSSQIKGKS